MFDWLLKTESLTLVQKLVSLATAAVEDSVCSFHECLVSPCKRPLGSLEVLHRGKVSRKERYRPGITERTKQLHNGLGKGQKGGGRSVLAHWDATF